MQNTSLPADNLLRPHDEDPLLIAPQPIRVLRQADKNIMPQFYPSEFTQPSSHTPLNATRTVTHTPGNASLLSQEGPSKPKSSLKASSAEFVPSWQNSSCASKPAPSTYVASAAPAARPTLPVQQRKVPTQQRKAPAQQRRAPHQQRPSHSSHAKYVSSVYSPPPYGFRHTPKTYFEYCIHYLEMHPQEAEEEMVRYFALQQQRSAQYSAYQVQAQPAPAVQHGNSKPVQCKEADDNSKTLFEMFEEMEKLLASDTESDTENVDEIEELPAKEAPADRGCKDTTPPIKPSQKSKSPMNQRLARGPSPDPRDNFKERRVLGQATPNRRTPLDHQMQSKAKAPRAVSENGQRQRTSGSTGSWRRSVSESPKYRPPQVSPGSTKMRSSSMTPSPQAYRPPQASPNGTPFSLRSNTPGGSRRRSPQSSPAGAKFGSRAKTPASSRRRSPKSSPAGTKFDSRSNTPASSRRRSPQSSPAGAKFGSRAKTPAVQVRRISASRSPSTGKNESFQKMAKGPNSNRGFALQRTIRE